METSLLFTNLPPTTNPAFIETSLLLTNVPPTSNPAFIETSFMNVVLPYSSIMNRSLLPVWITIDVSSFVSVVILGGLTVDGPS